MRRFMIYVLAVTVAILALGGVASAQAQPEFKLGFKTMADLIPGIVGTPLEDEHYAPNGDSLQRTAIGLMVWRKVDNWTAFTNGSRTWVNGPFGLQERGNDERFGWEAEATPSMAAPTPAPAAASNGAPSPTPAATPTPTPAPAPKPNLRGSQPNVIRGQRLEANSVWVLGEVHNEGSTPAYNVTVTARLLTDSGTVASTANQVFAFLGPGDTVGYRIEVRGVAAYARAEALVDSSTSGFASFTRVPIDWVKNEQVKDSQSHMRYEFTGTLNNSASQPVSLSAVYVWFLDDQDRAVWMDRTYVANSLAPGDSYTFSVRTPRDTENPQLPTITQVRYYAAGQLP